MGKGALELDIFKCCTELERADQQLLAICFLGLMIDTVADQKAQDLAWLFTHDQSALSCILPGKSHRLFTSSKGSSECENSSVEANPSPPPLKYRQQHPHPPCSLFCWAAHKELTLAALSRRVAL